MQSGVPGNLDAPSSSRPTRPLFVVDAFADRAFGGNPAGVVDVGDPATVDDDWMASVAAELGFSETAFVARLPGKRFSLRWLTPSTEVDLCGHATLGAAQALLERGEPPPLRFETRSGTLLVEPTDGGRLAMRFPLATVHETRAPAGLADALGAEPRWVGQGELGDLVVLLADEAQVRALRPDLDRVRALGGRAVVVTAAASPGSPYDFVSRVFAPNVGVAEDPVTGSAHCELAELWSARLGRRSLVGYQASARAGTVGVEIGDDHVLLTGRALVVVRGEVRAPDARELGPEPTTPSGEAPTVVLVRHGQTSLNAAGVLRGRLDPPLDEVGRGQADALGAALGSLPICQVRSSPLRRTRQTAEPIAQHHHLAVVDDERLADRDWGPFAGAPEAEVRARYGSLDDLPGAEPRDAVCARAEAALAEATRLAAPSDVVVLVTHDALIRELLAKRLSWPRPADLVPQRTGSWNVLVRQGERWLATLVDQQPETVVREARQPSAPGAGA